MVLVSVKFLERGIGLISTLILARLLLPEDFGVIAIAMLVVYFFEALTLIGGEQYLTRKRQVDCCDLDTAWTINIIFRSFFLVLLLLLVPSIHDYYAINGLDTVLYALSSILILGGVKNPGFSLYNRNFNYRPVFINNLIKKLVGFTITVGLAVVTESYWSVIIGSIVSMASLTVGSYILHPYRPRLSLSRAADQWAFSKWLFLKGLLGYTRAQLDTAVVSILFPVGQLGKYHLVRDISVMPAIDIIQPATVPLLAGFSKIRDEQINLFHKLDLSIFMLNVVIVPLCVYIYFYSELILRVVLGSAWVDAAGVFANLVFLLYSISVIHVISQFLISIGKVRDLFVFDLITTIFIFVCLITIPVASIENFALLRGFLGVVVIVVLVASFKVLKLLKIFSLAINLATPLVLSLAAIACAQVLPIQLSQWHIAELLLSGLVFMLVYLLGAYLFVMQNFFMTDKSVYLRAILFKLIKRQEPNKNESQ